MTVTFPDDENLPQSVASIGSGAAVGGHNYGTINTPIDDTTKKLLAGVVKAAPALGQVVREFLDKGIIRPELVYALERAAWAINEEVALMIRGAANNINEDVATMLMGAGKEIKEGTENNSRLLDTGTSRIDRLVERLEQTSTELAEVQRSYEGAGIVYQLGQAAEDIGYHASVISGTVTPPPARTIVNWKATLIAFVIGVVVGMAILAGRTY
jgi:hypothetical protein